MSVVYFLQAGADGPIKIGFTTDLRRRIAHLQAGCPEPLVLLATIKERRQYETRLHWGLAPHRHRGEWFRPSAEVLEAVKAAREGREYVPSEKAIAEVSITGGARLLSDIERFCTSTGMPENTLGRMALKDWKFVKELRCGRGGKPRRAWPETERKIRHFMATYHPDAQQADAA